MFRYAKATQRSIRSTSTKLCTKIYSVMMLNFDYFHHLKLFTNLSPTIKMKLFNDLLVYLQ